MFKRFWFTALALLASCALINPVIQAQTATQAPIQQSFSLSSAGQRLPTLTFTGPIATCAIVIYNSGGGFTLTPQVASDAQNNPTPSWVTATTVNGGSITSASTFVGNIAGAGTTAFGGVLASLTSGTVTGVESCTAASPGGTVAVASLPPISGAVQICSASGAAPCVSPTATPGTAGYALTTVLPALGALACTDTAGGSVATTPNEFLASCGDTTAGPTIATNVCNGSAFNGSNTCVKVSTPADSTTASSSAFGQNFGMLFNGSNWDRQRAAASPAPAGVTANGFNTAGVAAPIICTKTAAGNGTTDANVQIIALSGTTHVYVCEADLSVEGTAAGRLTFLSGTGTACATPVNTGPGVVFGGVSGSSSNLTVGDGMGIVFDGGAGNELCIGGTGTSALYVYHVMYEQF